MNIRSIPDPLSKLAQIGMEMGYESAGDNPSPVAPPSCHTSLPNSASASSRKGLEHSLVVVSTPTGKKPMLQTMVTTACERNCHYCVWRAGRSQTRRLRLKPDELAQTFDLVQRAGLVDGLFLSSGIVNGGVTTQDKIIDTAEILRGRYGYRGYLHLKIMPGAERDQVQRTMQLADRVSVNVEGPTEERVEALAPRKNFYEELIERLLWTEQIRKSEPGIRASTATQFVVGAVGDTDLEILSLTERLTRQAGLRRAYYSAFSPVPYTPFEGNHATNPLRQHRLYQASFLLRDYGWDVEELGFESNGNLPLGLDPKRAWAESVLKQAPLEILTAGREELMRIPGIGPKGADAILKSRRLGHIDDLATLRAIGIRAPERAAPYILLGGRRPPQQLPLF